MNGQKSFKLCSFEITPELFELIGALLGDGSIKYYKTNTYHNYGIEIYGNVTEDMDYLKYLAFILQKISGKKLVPRKKRAYNVYMESLLVFSSKPFAEFLIHDVGLSYNNKTYAMHIPERLLGYGWDKLRLLIRGLCDTDGTIFFGKKGCYKKHSYPMIEIKSISPKIIEQVHKILQKKGFKARVRRTPDGYGCLYLSGKEQINLWMKEIGFKNPKHNSKYLVWKKLGYYPPGTSLEQRMEILSRGDGTAT